MTPAAILILTLPMTVSAMDRAVPGYQGQTREIIDRAIKQYQSAQSYQDKLTIKTEIAVEGDKSVQPPDDQQQLTLVFARPNRISLQTPMYALFSDGKKFWQAVPMIEQYVELTAPPQLDLEHLALGEFAAYQQLRHPIANVLTCADASVTELLGRVTKFTATISEVTGGTPAHRISGLVEVQVGPNQFEEAPFDAWFNKETALLEQIRSDYTKLVGANGDGPKVKKFVRSLHFDGATVNPKVADDRFVFKPTAYDEKKKAFRVPEMQELQRKLTGRPAPDFKGKTFDGSDLSLSTLKGRVVVLDFWATWCGPCIIAMPHMQKLADQYAGKPVSLIGVNGDGPQARDQIASILKRNEVTFRQFMDSDQQVTRAYRIAGVPSTILIDKNGVVQSIHTGFSFGETQLLAHEIDKLLKGESLVNASTTRPALN